MIVDAEGNEFFVFDGHTHLGSRPFKPVLASADHDAEQLISAMNAAGVDMAVAFPRGNPHTDYYEHNDRVIKAMEKYPDRIVAYARIQPYFKDRAVDHVAEFAERGARGLKIHPFMDFGGTPVNSEELMYPLLEEAAKHKMSVLIHSGEGWNCSPTLIGDLAVHHPDVPVIVGHCGGFEHHQEAIVNARRIPNLFLDTAEVAPPMVVTNCVRAVGADRVMYGSDIPSIPIGNEIGKVAKYAGLSVDELHAVMGQNLARILDIDIDTTGRARVELASL